VTIPAEQATIPGGALKILPTALFFLGAVCIVFTVIGAGSVGAAHALASYHVGFLYALSLALGSLGLVMIFNQFNAGWAATVRRQLENVAGLMPVVAILGAPVLIAELGWTRGALFGWLKPGITQTDVLAQTKQPFLNPWTFVVASIVYFGIWSFLGVSLYRISRKQDETGDRELTAKARWISSFGLLLYALTTAFAAFHWIMSMQFHWFSTMWGVYFFAGNILSGTCLLVVTLALVRRAGALKGMVTAEHFHDLGKLVLAFTVFWAYIAFCQYFLIWYSNIPEETAWYILRKQHGWENLFYLLCLGHFLAPFLVLLFRGVKRNMLLIGSVAAWLLVMHAADLFFMVRPVLTETVEAYHGSTGMRYWWLDLFGILGPVCLFLGAVAKRAVSTPLVPLRDPRLAEALEHKNYV
jgi:hypothetical protein